MIMMVGPCRESTASHASRSGEAPAQGVVEQQAARQAVADPQDLLQDLGGLQRADHADRGAQDAHLGTVGHRAGRRWLGEDAAVGRVRLAVRPFGVGLQGREVAVEGSDRGERQRLAGQVAGIADEVARGEVVRPVGDDVVARDEL
jgi:hypothetical protein